MIIGIVGAGVVGKALVEGFKRKGHGTFFNDIFFNDICPIKGFISKKELAEKCDVIFVCVPTPSLSDGEIMLKHVYDVLGDFDRFHKCPPLIIKSTVIPGTTLKLMEVYPRLIIANNPEFLREKTALQDFLNPDRTVIGSLYPNVSKLLLNLYSDFTGAKILTDPSTSEMIKYVSNIFLVMKVAYVCEVHRVCSALGIDAAEVMRGVGFDKRIGTSHLNPNLGPISTYSPCLPKDILAFTIFLEQNGIDNGFFKRILECGIKTECNNRSKG